MKVARAQEMREAEEHAFSAGLPSRVLMEMAGGAIARAAAPYLAPGGTALVLAGPGQNGGDGLAAARHLLAQGARLSVWLLASPQHLRGDALEQYRILQLCKDVAWIDADSDPQGRFDVAIDAIFGISLRGEIEGSARRAVEYLARCGTAVVAADLPSGVRADSGEIAGVAVRASRTVALGALKPGHVFLPGRAFAGEIILEPLGLLPQWTEGLPLTLVDRLPPGGAQGAEDPKQAYGRALIIAGSGPYPGAAWLAARGAARGGAGLVVLASTAQVLRHGAAMPEVIVRPLPEAADGGIDPTAIGPALWQDAQAIAIGPGLGEMADPARWREAILAAERPLVLDADGLRAFAGDPEGLAGRRLPTVLTPHRGEAARLLGREVGEEPQQRLEAAQELARRANCVVLLKGQPTFVAVPPGRTGIVDAGGPELASAGTGDVLTGVLAAQLAQGIPARPAAERAALAHGRAGASLRAGGPRGHLASEVADLVPQALLEDR